MTIRIACFMFLAVELEKALIRRGWLYDAPADPEAAGGA